MLKRIIAMLLTIIMALGMFSIVGCGDSGANGAFVIPEEGFNTKEKVEIRFTHTMGQANRAILDRHIAEFNKIYPNIKIVHEAAGGWEGISGQITTEISGKNPPNIAYCYPDHVAMYNLAGAVVPLDSLIDSDMKIEGKDEILGLTEEQKNDFIKTYYDEGKIYGDGKMYTLPFSKSTELLFYNKTFFDEHGLTPPTTWEELWELCAKIKEIDPECYPLGYDSEANWFITLCEQMGTDFTKVDAEGNGQYLFDNDANKKFVKELREYYQKGYFTTKELYGSYTSKLFVNQKGKKSYMSIGSTGGTRNQMSSAGSGNGTFPFEVGVAPIPQHDPKNSKVISQGPSLCILKSAKTTDQQVLASWLFVKFLTTNFDLQAEYSMDSGYMPVIQSVLNHDAYKAWLERGNGKEGLCALAVKLGIEIRDDYFVSPAFRGSSKAREQVGAVFLKCILAEANNDKELNKAFDEAFKEAIEECEY